MGIWHVRAEFTDRSPLSVRVDGSCLFHSVSVDRLVGDVGAVPCVGDVVLGVGETEPFLKSNLKSERY